jgi:outer membrane autotransporter protein
MRSASFSMKKTVFLAVLMSSTAIASFDPREAFADPLIIDGNDTETINTSVDRSQDSVVVGSSGASNATLIIEGDGELINDSAVIGESTNSQGQVIVTGSEATWTNSTQVWVGYNGTGALTIENGGSVTSLSGFIGNEASAEGTVTVTGEGSTWTNTDDLLVGYEGAGTLTIERGAKVSNAFGYIGYDDNAQGTVTVTGEGSTWTNNRDIYIGLWGASGALTIADNGKAIADGTVWISYDPGTIGTLNIGAAAGETAVAAGTLEAAAVEIGGDGDGTLVFNHTNTDYEFSAPIYGLGTIEIHSGTTTLSGDNSGFDGITDIYGGTLLVTDVLDGSIAVAAGGTLGGTGTAASTNVASGGTIAPGLSGAIGTLTVDGSLTFFAGSTYAVDIDADTADLLVVNNSVTISGGTVSVTSLDSQTSYQTSQTYTILSAGSLSGNFTDTLSNSAFLDVSTETVGDEVELTVVVNDAGGGGGSGLFTSVAATGNQTAVAGALETLDQSGDSLSLYNDILVLDANDARKAFEQLSGDAYAGQQTALMQGSLAVNSTINGRIRSVFNGVATTSVPALGYAEEKPADTDGPFTAYDAKKTGRQADPERFAVWGSGFGTRGSSDGLDGASGTDSTTGGLLIGADGMVTETWRVGLFAGYSGSSFDTDNSSGNSDNYHLGAYAGTEIGRLAIRSGLSYTWSDVDTTRSVSVLGQTLDGRYDAASFNAFGEVGYRIDLSDTALEPFAGLAYTHLKSDAFTETGGTAALSVDGSTMDTAYTTLGLRAAHSLQIGGMATVARGTLGWMHAFGDVDPTTTARFVSGDAFTVSSTPIDSDVALIEAGFDLQLDHNATLGFGYTGQFGKSAHANGFNAKLRVQF